MAEAPEKSLRQRALELLARREHARSELERRLAPHAEDPAELAAVLDEFERRGWISDRRAVDSLVARRRGRFGVRRIEHELREIGVREDVISEALPGIAGSEFDNARTAWRKRFGRLPASPEERAKQARFLLGRGFDSAVVRRVLAGDADGEDAPG